MFDAEYAIRLLLTKARDEEREALRMALLLQDYAAAAQHSYCLERYEVTLASFDSVKEAHVGADAFAADLAKLDAEREGT